MSKHLEFGADLFKCLAKIDVTLVNSRVVLGQQERLVIEEIVLVSRCLEGGQVVE